MNRNSLFIVSKQIGEEVLDYAYGENNFQLQIHRGDERKFKITFSKQNLERMKYLLVIARPSGMLYPLRQGPDNMLWSQILPNLKTFCLVAEQPMAAGNYYNAQNLEKDVEYWIRWVKTYLQCFGQLLQSTTGVEVDVDDRKETSELVEEYLPTWHQKIRCKIMGDLVFKRG